MKLLTALIFFLFSLSVWSQTEDEKWCLENFRKSYENSRADSIISITVKNSCIKTLPDEVFKMKNLEILSIDFNTEYFKTIPSEIGELKKLTSISLIKANIESLPTEFWNLTNLISIQIIGGNIKELPKEIENLRKLKYLELRLGLTSLPNELQNLTQLKNLNLKGNQIPLEQIELLRKKLPHCKIEYDK